MLNLADYAGPWFRHPDLTPERVTHATRLIDACNALADEMVADGVAFPTNSRTGSHVSGTIYGGFRPQLCPQGAPHSAHKDGLAVDIYDPLGHLDAWLMAHQDALERHGIYLEHPDHTPGWSHWGIRAPKSGKHVFMP